MANITSAGVGSGIDINSLTTSIIKAEKEPATKRLDFSEAKYQAELSAVGNVKSALFDFKTKLASFASFSGMAAKSVTSSNEDVLTAVGSGNMAQGKYTLRVTQLAKSHSLASDGYSSTKSVVGTGTLEFRFGTTAYNQTTDIYTSFTQNPKTSTKSIVIDSTNNTLEGVRDKINTSNIGVIANIIYDGQQYHLTMTPEATGASNSLEVVARSDGDGNLVDVSGLSALAFNASATNLQQKVTAQDALLTINGMDVSSASNTVKDYIPGLTLDLKRSMTVNDADVMVGVGAEPAVLENQVRTFVSEYNNLSKAVQDLVKYDPNTKTGGVLIGDSFVRGVMGELRRLVNGQIANAGAYKSLAEIGITTARSGELEVNASKLTAAVKADPDSVAALLGKQGKLSASGLTFGSAASTTPVGKYSVVITAPASHSSVTGSGAANLAIVTGTNDSISLSIDGVSGQIVLPTATYVDANALAADLQSRINGLEAFSTKGISVAVNHTAGVLKISSDSYGQISKVNIVGGNGASALFGVSPVSTDGADVAGTFDSVSGVGSGLKLKGSGMLAELSINTAPDVTPGQTGVVYYSKGVGSNIDEYLSGVLSAKGQLSGKVNGIKDHISDIAKQRKKLDARMAAYEQTLRMKFNSMDSIVGKLRSTGDYLTQQMANLSGAKNK